MFGTRWIFKNVQNVARRLKSNTQAEPEYIKERRDLLLWQLKVFSMLGCGISSVYLTYQFIKNDFDVDRTMNKVESHWSYLIHDGQLPVKLSAKLNSKFNPAINPQLKSLIANYFINADLKKDVGVRRSDIISLLEGFGLSINDESIEEFINVGEGPSKDNKLSSGCSLQEFGRLIESLVLEQKLKFNDAFELKLIEDFKNIVQSLGFEEVVENTNNFTIEQPLISDTARAMELEVRKFVQEDEKIKQEFELEQELERNINLRDKLTTLSKTRKLSSYEQKQLNNIHNEIEIINDELKKYKRYKKFGLW